MGFTGFCYALSWFRQVLLGFTRFLLGFYSFFYRAWMRLGWIGFEWFSTGFAGFFCSLADDLVLFPTTTRTPSAARRLSQQTAKRRRGRRRCAAKFSPDDAGRRRRRRTSTGCSSLAEYFFLVADLPSFTVDRRQPFRSLRIGCFFPFSIRLSKRPVSADWLRFLLWLYPPFTEFYRVFFFKWFRPGFGVLSCFRLGFVYLVFTEFPFWIFLLKTALISWLIPFGSSHGLPSFTEFFFSNDSDPFF